MWNVDRNRCTGLEMSAYSSSRCWPHQWISLRTLPTPPTATTASFIPPTHLAHPARARPAGWTSPMRIAPILQSSTSSSGATRAATSRCLRSSARPTLATAKATTEERQPQNQRGGPSTGKFTPVAANFTALRRIPYCAVCNSFVAFSIPSVSTFNCCAATAVLPASSASFTPGISTAA